MRNEWKDRQGTDQKVFHMVGTHPASGGEGGEGWVQTIHVEEQRAVVTLDQGTHSAAPKHTNIHEK